MIYLDTSFVLPYYLNEDRSEAVADVLSAASGRLAVSDWTLAEFSSVLARLMRTHHLSRQIGRDTMRLFTQDARQAMYRIEPARADFDRASKVLLDHPDLGLRTPDALHLALSAERALTLYTLDRRLLEAATEVGASASDAGLP